MFTVYIYIYVCIYLSSISGEELQVLKRPSEVDKTLPSYMIVLIVFDVFGVVALIGLAIYYFVIKSSM